MNDIEMMRIALEQARKAVASGDVPVGAAIFNASGELIATGHNERELHKDPTAHAEIVAIRRASERLGDWHLTDHTLVVTLEPCAMCVGAIAQSRLQTVVLVLGMKKLAQLDQCGIYCEIREVLLEPRFVQVF